ncbi:hypothetical protein N0V88_005857 [Collariella sp. IMI 366227]|nr:hypothetical protein N0V88_005857 [Collariella sp. IMI 366227]
MSLQKYRWINGHGLPIAPPPATSSPFTYGLNEEVYSHQEDVFRMDGIAQAKPQDLHPLKKWYTTQLYFYGISFKKSARKSDLRDALQQALNAGKCEDLAPSVAHIRDRLRKEYNEAHKRLEDKKFAEIKGGHAEEANSDPPRFVAKYFLDSQGRPDKTKTKVPLSFNLWNHKDELVKVVNAIPGLAILKTMSRAFVGWEGTMEAGIEQEFARLENLFDEKHKIHSAQANVDLKLFLRKYLSIELDGTDITTNPRPSAPVTLSKWELQDQNFPATIVSKAPGLHMRKSEWYFVIGWDIPAIETEISRLKGEERRQQEQAEAEERAAREEEKAEKKARRDRRLKGYTQLLAKQQQRPSPLGLDHLVGSYFVEWENNGDYGDPNDPYCDSDLMNLNIRPPKSSHGVKATFDFGIVEGVMLLGMSKRAVEQLREEQPKYSEYSDPEDGNEEDKDEDNYDAATGESKPKLKSAGEKRSLREVADPYGVLAARAKRQKMEAPKREQAETHPNRVYFQFVCSEINAYPLVDDKNEHVGYLDFDQTGLAAKGVFYLPEYFSKEPKSISVFKIAEKPKTDREMKRPGGLSHGEIVHLQSIPPAYRDKEGLGGHNFHCT